jgi:hypothetical protein
MQILFYTLSTPDHEALECSKLLHKSLKANLGDINFKIVAPIDQKEKYETEITPAEKIRPDWDYIGDLKYSPTIFNLDYDRFIYIDSDVLWFKKDFNKESNLYCYESYTRLKLNEWCSTGWDIEIKRKYMGINAGFFSLSKDLALKLSQYMQEKLKKNLDPPKLEQSMFNMFFYSHPEIIWKDMTDRFRLYSNEKTSYSEDKIFHFNYYEGHMRNKLDRMKMFLENNHIKL